MPYAAKQDMIDRFGEAAVRMLTDRTKTNQIDDQVLGRALSDADAEIDAYLVGQYRLPLAQVPRVLVPIACDIARYRLFERQATEEVRNRYRDAVRFLENVAAGRVSLGLDSADASTPAVGRVAVKAPDPVFGADGLADY